MADVGVQFSLIGLESLLEKLKGVSDVAKGKAGRAALRKAAKLIEAKARQGAAAIDDPETAKNTAKNIAIRWASKYHRRTGNMMFRVGVLGGAGGRKTSEKLSGLPGLDTRNWRHVEFGTENSRARPFMRPALRDNISAATNEFVRQMERSIDRAIKKAAKK